MAPAAVPPGSWPGERFEAPARRPRRAFLLTAGVASAQELEPRAYSPSPTGTTFRRGQRDAIRRARCSPIPSAALTDVEADIGIVGVAAGRMFALMGKSVLVFGRGADRVGRSVRSSR